MSIRRCRPLTAALVTTVLLNGLFVASCDNDDESRATVLPLISDVQVLQITGASEVIVTALSPFRSGFLLAFDEASRSVLLLSTSAEQFTAAGRLIGATGFDPVRLGPFDELEEGVHRGDAIAADRETGLLLRLKTDGTARQHATPFQITSANGRAEFQLALPRAFVLDLVLVQDLVSGHVLLFDADGDGRIAVERTVFAAAAGVDPAFALASGWTRGGESRDQYARFGATRTVVRVGRDRTVERHVEGDAVDALFPGVTRPGTLDLVSRASSDALFILIAENFLLGTGRGAAIARADSKGGVEVFASQDDLEDLLGDDYDLSSLVMTSDNRLFAIDEQGSRVITFEGDGTPILAASKAELQDAAQSDKIVLTVAAALDDEGIVVFEAASDRHILVR